MLKMKLAILIAFIFSSFLALSEEARLLRYPNTSASELTFVYGGDVYTVPISGGIARRITSYAGYEMYPRFSNDGTRIAFTGEYDGNREIYVIPNIGGVPERITYSVDFNNLPERMGPDKIIMQWVGNDEVLYRSRMKSWNVLVGNLFKVNTEGSLPVELPIPKGGYGYLSPDGTKLAYNRIFREYRTWKRYSGGQADDIWIYDFNTKDLKNITNNAAQDIIPMWAGNKIYFLSDRDFTMNLFCYDIKTQETRKITNFVNYDVKFPSLGADHIAFENGGYIYLMDLATEEVNKVNIQIANDFPYARNEIVNVKDKISSGNLSPDGKRAALIARGDLFSIPAKDGRFYNLTKSSGEHDRNAVWSPDGKWIAYVSDKSGEDEIYIVRPDGSEEIQLTNNADSYRYELKWSPDSEKILFSDKELRLFYIDILTKKQTMVAESNFWEFRQGDYDWSPDNNWIVYKDYNDAQFSVLYLYNLNSKEKTKLTSDYFNSSEPKFAPGGKYIFFKSDRTFRGERGAFEYNFTYDEMTTLFGLTLQDSTINPFAKYNEDQVGEKTKKPRKIKKNMDADIQIDLTNIKERIFELPGEAANYRNLYVSKKHRVYYVRSKENGTPSLYYYDFPKMKEEHVGDISNFSISFDEDKIFFTKGGEYYIQDLDDKINLDEGRLDLSKLEINLDKRAEWRQIYNESWRQFKYFFYDPGMHGYDWEMVRKKYEPLIDHVVTRTDLTYVIGEMIGELDVGHAYVSGGDKPEIKEVPIGLLATDYKYESGYYKFENILKGRNWEEKTRSPLTEPGLNIKEGDYLISIDGEELSETYHPYKALVNKAEEFVELTINSKPSKDGSRKVWVKTIASENELRYFNWVQSRMDYVAEKTDGNIGYVHIPDMGFGNGLNEFVKYFYPQLRKKALIIDDRYNGGGNVSPLVIERLRREVAIGKHARNQKTIWTTPGAVMPGPMVCLINEQSMSDGDLFPYQFKEMELGPVIGKRTWGGVIGIRGSLPLLDGSDLRKPEFANYGAKGKWILEDVGMVPDIEIDNLPNEVMNGVDAQLDKGIEVIRTLIPQNMKPQRPELPPFPNKYEEEKNKE